MAQLIKVLDYTSHGRGFESTSSQRVLWLDVCFAMFLFAWLFYLFCLSLVVVAGFFFWFCFVLFCFVLGFLCLFVCLRVPSYH